MRVLYIDTPLDPPGGGQYSLRTLLGELPPEVERTVFLDRAGTFLDALGRGGVPAQVVTADRLYAQMRALSPDLVHCNSATTRYSFRAALAALRLGLPFVWHNRVTDRGGWRERLIAFLSSRVLAISGAVAAKFEHCSRKVRVVHNGVDVSRFSPGEPPACLRASLDIGPNQIVLGAFSRLYAWKGHELLFKAIGLLPGELRSRVTLLLAGDGPERGRLENLAANATFRAVFAGFREDIPELMRLCDAVVSPSVMPEGFGRVLIEAMACAKPVISTALGGPVEVIENGADGLLVQAEPEALAVAIRSVLPGGGRDAAALGQAARNKVLKRFSARASAEAVAEIYRELLDERKKAKLCQG